MRTLARRITLVLVLLLAGGAVAYAFMPRPVPVDLAEIKRGPMRVSVDEDGITRIKERYVVSAPLAGRLQRIRLDEGDSVDANQTVIAIIEPTDPALLDARAQAQAEARVRAAEAAVLQAKANLERARTVLDHSELELTRTRDAFNATSATRMELDDRIQLHRIRTEEFDAAQFACEITRFELEQARSALLLTRPLDEPQGTDAVRFEIRSPITGKVLRVLQESVAVVTPGAPLLELGDANDLEIVIDVLSTDAVKIRPGAAVVVEHWGGERKLEAVVRLVEPSAFTKISALGVEEQRVNIIADLQTPREQWATLGDNFRIEAAIVLWEEPSVTQVPTSALFRTRGEWSAFVVESGRASIRRVQVGRQNSATAQVIDGLAPGERVIQHPSDRLSDGVRVEPRENDE